MSYREDKDVEPMPRISVYGKSKAQHRIVTSSLNLVKSRRRVSNTFTASMEIDIRYNKTLKQKAKKNRNISSVLGRKQIVFLRKYTTNIHIFPKLYIHCCHSLINTFLAGLARRWPLHIGT